LAEPRPRLGELARRLGVEDGYHSALSHEWVAPSDATREALVAAMGFEASSEAAAARALASLPEPAPPPPPGPPERCLDVAELLGGRRAFGLWCNLYSLRSARSWGFGSLGDLAGLVRSAAACGADFVGLSPLHALLDRPGRFCPYAPVSRVFRDPLYLEPERIPEWDARSESPEARRAVESPALRARVAALRRGDRLDPAGVEAALFEVLRPLHACFLGRHGARADRRRADFAAFRDRGGESLERFATFQALAGRLEARGSGRDWDAWPAALRDPGSGEVRAFRAEHVEEVGLHAWLQFELDRQLGLVAKLARAQGLAIGLYTDLALGSTGGGSDTWSWPGLFAHGVSVGAPPDAFSRAGQDWGFPPLDPHALRGDGRRYWQTLLNANLRHAGALRIDHALGLRRLFWIPAGAPPSEGAYVRYPEPELLADLARASRRHRALVIAEDLGTVPEGFSEAIQARGMLSSRVLLFERDAAGFRPADAWPEACLATANTHDLPPLAALAGEDDLALRRRVGQIPDDQALEALRAERRADREALRERLARDGLLADRDDPDALAAGVTAFLCATRAVLVGLSLDDLAGEREPINLPGVAPERHPSWLRRMSVPLERLFETPRARRVLAAVPDDRRSPRRAAPPGAPADAPPSTGS